MEEKLVKILNEMADYLNISQMKKLQETLLKHLAENEAKTEEIPNVEYLKMFIDAKQIEGYQSANWILMDYKDIIVHVFSKEDRAFYDLERIWRDGKQISKEDLQ